MKTVRGIMSTMPQNLSIELALSSIPKALRKKLLDNYSDLKSHALENQYDSIGTKAGKLSEVILRVLQHVLTGTYTPLSKNLGNFKTECENLEKTPKTAGPEGLRLIMPRALSLLYTFRNKRDFGHTGGEVDANEIDAVTATRIADWCVSELIRALHAIPIEDAQLLCDSIAERQLPILWNVMGRKRVLDTSLGYREQTLLLLYSEIETGVPTEDLFSWTEHSHRANYRRDILKKLHKSRLIEWDKDIEIAIISPTGIQEVETAILPNTKK